jgi:hypothetical protein
MLPKPISGIGSLTSRTNYDNPHVHEEILRRWISGWTWAWMAPGRHSVCERKHLLRESARRTAI